MANLDPSQRQVLVSIGNRYVVFGSVGLPQPLRFSPGADLESFPAIEDEAEIAAERIEQTLRVAGMTRSGGTIAVPIGDVELVDDAGQSVLVELKVRDHDPKPRDFDQGTRLLHEAANTGKRLEIWYFNIERLKLIVMYLDRQALRIDELVPLEVWEKTKEGVYSRAQVLEEVDDWSRRIVALYSSVIAWLSDRQDLRCEQSRTVIMSEAIMQAFAVPDRDLPVLDVFEGDQVAASLVPRGLWLIGSWGRIDIITRSQTHILHALGGVGSLAWQLVSFDGQRRTRPFDKDTLLALIAEQ